MNIQAKFFFFIFLSLSCNLFRSFSSPRHRDHLERPQGTSSKWTILKKHWSSFSFKKALPEACRFISIFTFFFYTRKLNLLHKATLEDSIKYLVASAIYKKTVFYTYSRWQQTLLLGDHVLLCTLAFFAAKKARSFRPHVLLAFSTLEILSYIVRIYQAISPLRRKDNASVIDKKGLKNSISIVTYMYLIISPLFLVWPNKKVNLLINNAGISLGRSKNLS